MILYYTIRGHELECEFEFEEGEPMTLTDPGYPDIYTLMSAKFNGVDITELLDPAIVHELEGKAAGR